MAITGSALATSLGINGGVCAAFFLIFSILRVKPFTRKFYAPKRFDPEVVRKPRKLPLGLFSWVSPVLFYPEDEVLTVAGMDTAVMTRLLSYGWVLFAFCTFWCCALLMPINATAGYLPSVPRNATGQPVVNYSDLDLLSASNVRARDQRFWAHLGSAYIVTIVALALLLAFSRDVSRLRARYISTLARGGPSHTVLVTDIPAIDGVGAVAPAGGVVGKLAAPVNKARSAVFRDAEAGTKGALPGAQGYNPIDDDELDPWADGRRQLAAGGPEGLVRHEMEATYGARNVAAVNVVYDTKKLDPLLLKYNGTKQRLEDLNDDYIGRLRRGKQIKKRKQVSLNPALAPKWAKERFGVSGTKSVKVDQLEYLPQELDHLYAEMQTEREAVKSGHLPAAFVTFNDRASANAAATGLQTYDETAWRIQPAPGDDEVVWGNLAMRHKQRTARTVAMWAVFIAILVFYLPVTAAIQAVVNLDNARKIPGLGVITRIPFVTQVLQGILPTIVLKVFLIIMPPILAAMARFEGKVSVSQIDFSVVSRFFIFQVFATFIYQFVVGAAMSNISQIIANPQALVSLLGVSAAQSATFFMSFIALGALGAGLALLRLVPLIIYFIKAKLAGTERARYRLWAKQPFAFGTAVANHSLTILLGLSFCCVAPLIAPFCLMYFTFHVLAAKYQLIYVVTLPYDATGRMWINCFHQIMTGIYFLQLMTLCVLLVKLFPYALLVLPLLVVTVVFHVVNINLFKRPWTLMSLKEAAVLDARDHGALPADEAEAVRLKYLSPVFKVDDAEHRRLIHEAGQVDLALKGQASELKLSEPLPEAVEGDA